MGPEGRQSLEPAAVDRASPRGHRSGTAQGRRQEVDADQELALAWVLEDMSRGRAWKGLATPPSPTLQATPAGEWTLTFTTVPTAPQSCPALTNVAAVTHQEAAAAAPS